MPLPAMSGAEPCMGSYRPGVGLNEGEDGTQGAPARDAEGRRPRDPGMTLDSSERLKKHKAHLKRCQNKIGNLLHITE